MDSSSSSQLIIEGVCGVHGVDGEDTGVKVSLTVVPYKIILMLKMKLVMHRINLVPRAHIIAISFQVNKLVFSVHTRSRLTSSLLS